MQQIHCLLYLFLFLIILCAFTSRLLDLSHVSLILFELLQQFANHVQGRTDMKVQAPFVLQEQDHDQLQDQDRKIQEDLRILLVGVADFQSKSTGFY